MTRAATDAKNDLERHGFGRAITRRSDFTFSRREFSLGS
jgi:hypothetical protein